MNLYAPLFKSLLLIGLIVSISACGYKPSAKYVRMVTGEKISTNVIISSQDPENTVLIKDAVDSAIIEVFHSSIVDRKNSDSHLTLSIPEPLYTPIQYNQSGFVVAYRATIVLNIARETKNSKKKYVTKGTYDFAVVPNAVFTDKERFDAIKYSARKAINAFIAKISAEGSRINRK